MSNDYYEANRRREIDRSRKRNLMSNYGLTIMDVVTMLDERDGTCDICKQYIGMYHNVDTHIDHCHTTDTVRGILCRPCNLMLGNAKDSAEVLLNAIEYLKGEDE
jgi:hypothetical protein